MASPNPVPSRAVLNALRGVVFGTSCSVVLLAEERRRRIKTARTAIDNARKLHVVRSRRGSAALAERIGGWEGSLADHADVATLPPPPRTKGVRRRRRDSPLYIGQLLPEDALDDLADSLTASSLSARRDTPTARPAHIRTPQAAADIASPAASLPPSQRSLPIRYTDDISTKGVANPAAMTHRSHGSPPDAVRNGERSSEHAQTSTSLRTDSNNLSVHEIASGAAARHGKQGAVELARQCLDTPIEYDGAGEPTCADTLLALEALLGNLRSPGIEHAEASEIFDLAVRLLARLAPVGLPGPETPASLGSTGFALLKASVYTGSDKTAPLLKSILPLYADATRCLLSFTRWLQKHKHIDAMQQTLQHLVDHKDSLHWDKGLLADDVLHRSETSRASFEATKQMYQKFQDAGLFRNPLPLPAIQFKIRRRMAVLALEAGDDAFAQSETECLSELDPEATKADVKLRGGRIVRDAKSGLWTSVQRDLDVLASSTSTNANDLQNILVKITDIFAQKQPVDQLEIFVRNLVNDYDMILQHRWVYRVLGLHGSRQDLESTLSWLEFCKDSGFSVSEGSFRSFWASSLKYWGYSGVIVKWLQRAQAGASGTESQTNARGEEREPTSERDVFTLMSRLSREKQWGRVCEVYEKASPTQRFSDRCFRLSISAFIKQDRGNCERAVNLVHEAYEQGHDVSPAVMALLLAQLENGVSPVGVIGDVRQRGIRVHDSVYNKAAQKLMANGDLRGAAAMCEIAAKENGQGELAYNEYNLSNLVFSYAGLTHYSSLNWLLSRFKSQGWAHWHGSKICRESIKLAIKTTAKRAAVDVERAASHREANELLVETLEYIKSRPTTTHRLAVRTEILRLAGVEGEADQPGGKPFDHESGHSDIAEVTKEYRRPFETASGAA